MPQCIREQLKTASDLIKSGGVVAYPTESCFGLGCNPKNPQAVKRILDLKCRRSSKGLIIIAHHFDLLKPYIADIPQNLVDKMCQDWPAPISWLVPVASWVPKWLTGESRKIAVRIPAHSTARQLSRYSHSAIVSTSANRSGQSACRSAGQVRQVFADKIDFVFSDKCAGLKSPSKIIDLQTDQVIR